MRVEIVSHGSERYRSLVELRRRVLRLPIGLDFTPEELAAESDQHHFGVFDADQAMGTLIMVKVDEETAKMRQVAVDEASQGTGIGRELVAEAEKWAIERGLREIVLHARAEAVGFYLKLNYEASGEPFVEVGLPHRLMRKRLNPSISNPSIS